MEQTPEGRQMLSKWESNKDEHYDMVWCVAETCANLDKRLVEVERKVNVLGDALGVRQPAAPVEQAHPRDITDREAGLCPPQYLVVVHTPLDDVPVSLWDHMASAEREASSPHIWEWAASVQKHVFNRDMPQPNAVSVVTIKGAHPTSIRYIKNYPDVPPPEQGGPPNRIVIPREVLERTNRMLSEAKDDNDDLRAKITKLEEENASLMAKAEAMSLELESHRSRLDCNDALRTEIEELKVQRHDLRDALSTVINKVALVRHVAELALDD